MNPKTYRPSKAERARIWEYLALTAEDAKGTHDLPLAVIEHAIAEALFDSWFDATWDLVAEVAEHLAPEFDGKDFPEAALKVTRR